MKLQCGAVISDIPAIHLTSEQKERWEHWITALKSGKFHQVTHCLRNNQGFCCMGVACHLINPNGWVEDHGNYEFSLSGDANKLASTGQHLLPIVRRLYGGMGPLGFYISGRFPDDEDSTVHIKQLALTGLNDLGATFEEIAEILVKAMTGGYTYKVSLLQIH